MAIKNEINKDSQSWQVSLNTPIIQTIQAAQFDLYLGQINPNYFQEQEVFTWINLASAATDVVTVVVEMVKGNTRINQTINMRVGSFLPCRGLRILTGTDVSAIINVGVGN